MKNEAIKVYRHGDVLLREVKKLPTGKPTQHAQLTIALGEATGHHHTLYPFTGGEIAEEAEPIATNALPSPVEYLELDDGRFIVVREAMALRHQEHHELRIDPGMYEIIIEQEHNYFENAMRKVVD